MFCAPDKAKALRTDFNLTLPKLLEEPKQMYDYTVWNCDSKGVKKQN